MSLLHFMHEVEIPKQRPICKHNPEMGSRDYKFLNPKIAITDLNTNEQTA